MRSNKFMFESLLATLLFLVTTSATFSQVNFGVKTPYKIIYFGQKVDFGTLENTVSWTVNHRSGAVSAAYLKGNAINDFVFEKPGIYDIKFSENKIHGDECNHAPFDENMTVEVSPVKMVFDFSKITFSEKIQRGKSCDGIEVSVPVDVSFKGNAPTNFKVSDVFVAGIGSEIIAKPVQKELKLKEGTQILKYKLSGVANQESYLMFDFIDVNNQVQCYNLPQKIN